ncbi:MAG: hypothetical protein AAF549_04835 [Pseudomonadota bacterium]
MGIGTIAITHGDHRETVHREITKAHGDNLGCLFECRIDPHDLSKSCFDTDGELKDDFKSADMYVVHGVSSAELTQLLRDHNGVLEATTADNPEPLDQDGKRTPAHIEIHLQR